MTTTSKCAIKEVFWPRGEWIPRYTRVNYPREKRAKPRARASVCELKTIIATSSNLKYWLPSSASDGAVAFRRERRKLCFQNSPRKAQVALSWPKKDRVPKGYLKSKSKGGWWSQICQVTFCFAVNVQVETPEHLDLLKTNGQETFLNNPQEAGKKWNNHWGMVKFDRWFMKEMNKCKSATMVEFPG